MHAVRWSRARWLRRWSLAGVAAAAACTAPSVAPVDTATPATADSGGMSAQIADTAVDPLAEVASAASDGVETAGSVKKPCISSSQCAIANDPCRHPVCTDGVCSTAPAPDGNPCGSVECGAASCLAGQCVTKLMYADHTFDDVAVSQVNGGCGWGSETVLVGWGKVAGQAGQAAWLGRLVAKTPLASATAVPSSTLWQGGYAAGLNACDGAGKNYAVGWQQTGDGAERDSVLVEFHDGVVISATSLPASGDDELRAVAYCSGCAQTHGAAGEVTQAQTGLDARLVLDAKKSLVFAAAGDQYVRGLAGSGYQGPAGWVLCGYQSIGGGPADGWVVGTGADGWPKWTAVVGDNHVQRLNACVITQDTVLAVGVTYTPYGNKELLGRPWLVRLALTDGKLLWQRTQSLQWANGGELIALAHAPGGAVWTAGFLRAAGVDQPAWQRFDADGLLQAAGFSSEIGRAVFVDYNLAYLQDDWLTIGIRRDTPMRSVLALRNKAGGVQCACKSETACPGAKACHLSQCGGPCEKVWQGNPCPLPGEATGTCANDGSCLAP